MVILIIIGIAAGWAFFLALLIDRPDLLVELPQHAQIRLHIFFAAFFVVTLIVFCWRQIADADSPWKNGVTIVVRNALVMVAGLALLVFISRELLHGIDHTGHHKLW